MLVCYQTDWQTDKRRLSHNLLTPCILRMGNGKTVIDIWQGPQYMCWSACIRESRSASATTQMTSCLGVPSMDLTTDKMAHRKCHRPNAIPAPRVHVLLKKCTLTLSHRTARKHIISKFMPAGSITHDLYLLNNAVNSSKTHKVESLKTKLCKREANM